MSFKKIIQLFFFSFPIIINAQIIQEESCGHIEHRIFKKSNLKHSDEIKLFLDSCNYNTVNENIQYRIPVKFWIYRRTNGKDGLTDIKIKEHIRNLNYYHSINNTGFRFYLRTDNEYIDKDRLFKLKYIRQAPFQTLRRKSKGCINIHVAEKLKMNRIFNAAKNYSGTYNSLTNGVIIAKGVSSSTLTHEIGHYFGLKHPHKNWKRKIKGEPVSRTRLIPGTNTRMCETKGDGLCDTPAEPNLSSYTNEKCKYTGWNVTDKYGDFYKPKTDNIMSYTKNRECRNHFTQEQIAFMLFTASKNKYAKYWSVNNKDANKYDFDYFEPDNSKKTASELFLRTTQTHTFHKIFTKEKKLNYEDTVDWLYFDYKSSKPISLKLIISESDYEFPQLLISVFKEQKSILKSPIQVIEEPKELILKNIEEGRYFIRIVKNSSKKKCSGYKIKLGD